MTNWDKRFLELAKHISSWSKDPSTKVGAVCVDSNHRILSLGYNGFPKRIIDSESRLNTRLEKYKHVVHAEMNAIFNATSNGVSLNGAKLYVSGLSICSECAKGIIQVGIQKVIVYDQVIPDSWVESCTFAISLLEEAGVQYIKI